MSALRFGRIQTVKFFGHIQTLNSFVSLLVFSKKANFKKKLSALGHVTVNIIETEKKLIFNLLQIFLNSNEVLQFFLTKIKISKNKIKAIPNF